MFTLRNRIIGPNRCPKHSTVSPKIKALHQQVDQRASLVPASLFEVRDVLGLLQTSGPTGEQ